MSLNNNLSIFFSRLKISAKNKNSVLLVPRTGLNKKVLEALQRKGYISFFYVIDDRNHFKVFLKAKYVDSIFNSLNIISSPSRKIFLSYEDLVKKYKPYDFFIVSSSKGVFLGDEIFLNKVGGELLCDSFSYK